MSALETLLIAGERHIGRAIRPAIAPMAHRRHLRTLLNGSVSTEHEETARDSWWGDEPRWFAGGAPPRAHNRLTALIDGEAFFSRLHDALLGARQYVYVTGWCLTPHIPLLRGTADDLARTRLLTVLSEAASRVLVRILLWGGAPFLIQPTRRAAREVVRIVEEQGTGDVICRLDTSAQASHCHHQKSVVIDGQLASSAAWT